MSNIRPGSTNYYHLGGKIDPIAEIVNAGILTTGDVFWVKASTDPDYLEFKDRVGEQYCYTTIQAAINKCTDDQNDYVMVCPKNGGTPWDVVAGVGGINLNKDKVHLIAVGYNRNATDYAVEIRGFGTAGVGTAAGGTLTDYGLLYVTGNGCEIAGFKFNATAGTGGGGTIETGGACMSLYGDAPYVHDCAMIMGGGAWDCGTPGCAVRVGSAKHGGLIENCFVVHGTETADGTTHGVAFTFNNERWKIKDSTFSHLGVQNDEGAIYAAPGTIIGEGIPLTVENCFFAAFAGTGGDEVIAGTAAKNGMILMKDCISYGYTAFHSSDALVTFAPSFGGGTINNLLQNPGIGIPGTALVVTKT